MTEEKRITEEKMAEGIKTPLYERHAAQGANIVPFAGYLLPVQYSGVIEEHEAVRGKAGLFDVNHMGEILVYGRDALRNINKMFTNDFTDMQDGMVRYTLACNERGGIVDDLLVYRFSEERYMAVPNASNRRKVFDFISGYLSGDTMAEDLSDGYAQIALQGPRSLDVLSRLAAGSDIPAKYYSFTSGKKVAGAVCLISKTGYTGEQGYELYCSPHDAPGLWDSILEAGKDFGLLPCGLGARDTLRLEAGMSLYGHELNEDITPLEAGLEFAVKMPKEGFVGKEAILSRGAPVVARIGLKVTGRGIVRENCPVYAGEKKIGTTTSGTFLPHLKGAYAMAYVDKNYANIETVVEAEVRGKKIAAEIVPLPFYKRVQS